MFILLFYQTLFESVICIEMCGKIDLATYGIKMYFRNQFYHRNRYYNKKATTTTYFTRFTEYFRSDISFNFPLKISIQNETIKLNLKCALFISDRREQKFRIR